MTNLVVVVVVMVADLPCACAAACCLPACLGGGNEIPEGLDAIGPTTSNTNTKAPASGQTNRLNMLPQVSSCGGPSLWSQGDFDGGDAENDASNG